MTQNEIIRLNEEFADATPETILSYFLDHFRC